MPPKVVHEIVPDITPKIISEIGDKTVTETVHYIALNRLSYIMFTIQRLLFSDSTDYIRTYLFIVGSTFLRQVSYLYHECKACISDA